MINSKDRDHPFFRPLWRRVAIVAFCAVWAAWEFHNREMFWAVLVGAMAVYGAWTFLIAYEAGQAGKDGDEQP